MKCCLCGKLVNKDGFKISWNIENLDVGEIEDERYFCCVDCIRKWINCLGSRGEEAHSLVDNMIEINQLYSRNE